MHWMSLQDLARIVKLVWHVCHITLGTGNCIQLHFACEIWSTKYGSPSACDEVTATGCFVTTRDKLMSILSAGRILRKSISDILELVICELDLLYWFRVTFVIFKLVIFFPFSLTFTINQQNKHAFGLIPGQYCLVFLHDLTALLAGKQLYKNHMGVLFSNTSCT